MTQTIKPNIKKKSEFKCASLMAYAYNSFIEEKTLTLIDKLKEYLKTIKRDTHLSFSNGEIVYIPDLHGDFVHLIITLHRHGLLDNDLNLKKTHDYVLLGDLYDRGHHSDSIDYWLNKQIEKGVKIFRLIGNHEMAFFERDPNGYPVILPAQDSVKDIASNFQVTENLLKSIAEGNILAAYVSNDTIYDFPILYIHSFAISDDFIELGLEKNCDIYTFAHTLNERLKKHGEYAYNLFLDFKKTNKIDWKLMMKSFLDDPLFNMYSKRNDINTSFIWRRTGLPTLKIYPSELDDLEIPDVYQIVGHTPVFFFKLPNEENNKPFILPHKDGKGKIQFSDVGIGYHYKEEFDRLEVVINKKLAISI